MDKIKYNTKAEKLANIIESNPNCKIEIDNDCWYISDEKGLEIASSNEYEWSTDWYSHSSNYGAGVAEALVVLLSRYGFNIEASAV